jgi:DedD protein
MASNQLNEQEIQFKKRARRRLVGAIALVLLMVTILPMVLDDHSVKTPQQEIAITIPSQDNKDFTSKVVPIPDSPALPAEPNAPEDQNPGDVPSVKNVDVAEPAKAEPVTPTPVEKAAVQPSAPAKPAAPAKPVAQVKPAEATAAKDATQATASSGASVQIGVFSDSNNVKQLQQKLQGLGYKSYTEKVATTKGDKIRLRAGPFADRAEAESALDKIKGSGMTGMVVTK